MARVTIEVPDFLTDAKQRAKFEAALEAAGAVGEACGVYSLEIEHQQFCLERLGRGACNCDAKFTVKKHVTES